MITHLTLLVALQSQTPVPTPVDPATQPKPAGASEGWKELDRVVVIVNEDLITKSQLTRDLQRARRDPAFPVENENQMKRLEMEILRRNVEEHLRVQAGQNMGIDSKILEARVTEDVERLIENSNGVVGFGKFLQSRDLTTQDAREMVRNDLLGDLWTKSVTGEGPSGTRATRDRWVRPGQLLFEYRNAEQDQDPELKQKIGAHSEVVKWQQIVLPAARYGGEEATSKLALTLRERIEGGASMDELVESHSVARSERGILEVELERVQSVSPEIAQFLQQAAAGEISQPLRRGEDDGVYFLLIRDLGSTPAQMPSITTFETQKKVGELTRYRLENYRLERAYQSLIDGSYVWPPELAAR